MNCKENQRLLFDLAEAALPDSIQRQVMEHTALCSECTAASEHWREVVEQLQAAPRAMPTAELTDRIVAEARSHLAVRNPPLEDRSPTPQSTRTKFSVHAERSRHVLVSLAASLLLFLLGDLLLSSSAGAYPVIDGTTYEIGVEAVNNVFRVPSWWAEHSIALWEQWAELFHENGR